MCCSLPAMGQLSSRLRKKEMLVRTVRLLPVLLLPRSGLVEGRQQQFAFLSVADQAGSLLCLQGGFSERRKEKIKYSSSTACIIHCKPLPDGVAFAKIEMCNVGAN